jgi:succinate dehydrogenase/fumarate reductase flavoprotein subunit
MPVWSAEKRYCDVLVIGGGGAGLRAAITAKLCDTDVLLVSKSKVGFNSNTYISKAVIASTGWGPPADHASTHMADTVKGGCFLNDQALVAKVAEPCHAEIQFLRACGVQFGMHANKPQVIKTPGHQYARHVYGENWRGSDLVMPLKRRARQVGVRFAEQVYVTRLIAEDNRIGGATGITSDGRFYSLHAKVVVLATGGYAQIYLNTNNVPGITGDGQALAYEMGVPLKDMEFVQFYPTARGKRGSSLLLYERLLAQPGVLLRNADGANILKAYGIADATTVTRDRLAQVIYQELNQTESPSHGVFMDMEALSEQKARQLSALLPSRWWKGQKVFQVAPTAHFCMGGILTDQRGETSLKGLFAVGEATAGVHGANRLGGNALAEIFSLGSWVGETAAQRAKDSGITPKVKNAVMEERLRLENIYAEAGNSVKQLVLELKQLMWHKVGVIRQKRTLQEALDQLREPCPKALVASPYDLIKFLEYQNMRSVAKMVCRAALERTESRGSHYRSDYPEVDNQNWVKNIVLGKNNSTSTTAKTWVSLDLITMK